MHISTYARGVPCFYVVIWWDLMAGQCLRKPSAATLKKKKSFIVIIRPQPKQTNGRVTGGGGESLETVQKSKIKTKQQRLLPYFFVTHEFNCLFLFGESAYVNYALLRWREIRVKNIFQHKHKHFDRMQTWEVPPHLHHHQHHHQHRRRKSTPLSPAAHTLKEIKHLSFLSLAPAKTWHLWVIFLSSSSLFFLFFSWSGLGFPCRSRIQFTALFFFFSVGALVRLVRETFGIERWDWGPGPNR